MKSTSDAQRDLVQQLPGAGIHGLAHLDHVSALGRRDAQADGGVSVVAEQGAGRLHVAAPNAGHVAQVDLLRRTFLAE
jgi:hypothetical protein